VNNLPELVEDCRFRPHDTAILSVPQKAPEGAITRHESALDLLERVKKVSTEWIKSGHKKGSNTHNVSATVSIKDNEWETVGEWMWNNRGVYNGLSVLPYDGGTYVQAPYEDCDAETYESMLSLVKNVDLDLVIETSDETDLSGEIACGGGSCEIF
jgi:ribonucleoside-diphosphate reductase alpha chain